MQLSRVRVIALAAALFPLAAYGQDTTITVTPVGASTQPAVAATEQSINLVVTTTQPTVASTEPSVIVSTTQQTVVAGAPDDSGPTIVPATQAATQPAEKISADAQAVLDQMRDAYAKAGSIHLAGKFSALLDVAGQQQNHTATFDASYQSPNKFQHATTGESPEEAISFGSTGDKVYIYSPSAKEFATKDAPKERGSGKDLPFARVMLMQDPNILMAVAADASKELIDDSRLMAMTDVNPTVKSPRTIELAADEKIGDATFKSLKITGDGGDVSVLVSPDTHLVRRLTIDLKDMLTRRGQPGVKQALITYDYASADLNPALKPDQFAWTPPDGAKDIEKQQAAAEDDSDKEAKSLQGQAAPDFKLDGVDGKAVSLADLKGSVIVIDFWATWCGPCNASLPVLNQTAKDYADKGVKVYGIDLKEKKEDVAAFVKEKGLSIPMLLDINGDVATLYKVNGIPHTVVIGKDGVVRTVVVGFDPADGEKSVRDAIDAALK